MTTSFDIRPLTSDEVRRLYGERLTADFPPDEVKSLGVIEGAIARGGYACYGAVRDGEILAYAFFVIRAPHALFDYYAVRADLRDTGVGSRFIRALMDGPLQAYDCVLLEVDDPDAADSPAERATGSAVCASTCATAWSKPGSPPTSGMWITASWLCRWAGGCSPGRRHSAFTPSSTSR